MAWRYLDLADFLLVAEAVLDIPAEDLAKAARIDLAESALHAPAAEFGEVEFYTDLETKAAVLASRIIRNHPLPDGNKRVGYLCALEFVARNGGTWGRNHSTTPRAIRPSPSSKASQPERSRRTN